jgi:RHS repeat-associated protein
MTDNKGRAVNGYDYDPFGNSLFERTQQANPFQYDSGYLDNDTSLYKFGRYYDPSTGRWTQQDPVGGSLADLNSANRYTYASDDPINVVDPSGMCTIDTYLLIVLAAIVAVGAGILLIALIPERIPTLAAIITALTTPVTAATAPALTFLGTAITFAASAAGAVLSAIQCATGG